MSASTSAAASAAIMTTSILIANQQARDREERKEKCTQDYKDEQCHDLCVSTQSSDERAVDFWKSNYTYIDTNSCTGTVSEPYQHDGLSTSGIVVVGVGLAFAVVVIVMAFAWVADR